MFRITPTVARVLLALLVIAPPFVAFQSLTDTYAWNPYFWVERTLGWQTRDPERGVMGLIVIALSVLPLNLSERIPSRRWLAVSSVLWLGLALGVLEADRNPGHQGKGDAAMVLVPAMALLTVNALAYAAYAWNRMEVNSKNIY
jgi:hypothetical protein